MALTIRGRRATIAGRHPREGAPSAEEEDLREVDRRPARAAAPAKHLLSGDHDARRLAAETWVDTDGTHVLINSVEGYQKIKNIRRDPRVALSVFDAGNPFCHVAVRGHVLDVTPDGAVEHIEKLAQRYLGTAYPWYGGRDQTRLILTIAADKIHAMG